MKIHLFSVLILIRNGTFNICDCLQAAVYFNKIQCFCFEEQRLLPGEQIDMPVSVVSPPNFFSQLAFEKLHLSMLSYLQVFFYIDPEFEIDPRMDGINNIILSYTFFKVSVELPILILYACTGVSMLLKLC